MQVNTSGGEGRVTLPASLLEHLHLKDGDDIYVEQREGGVVILAVDQAHATQLAAARAVMREDEQVLRKLAQ